MNRYLEKIATLTGNQIAKLYIGGGALTGAALGGYAGYAPTHTNLYSSPWKSHKIELTKGERIFHGASSAISGAMLGAVGGTFAGVRVSPKMRAWAETFGTGTHGYGGKAGNEYRSSRSIHDIHSDLHMPKGGFKTKKEATDHFRRVRAKHHPDRTGNSAEANERMAKINRAWDEFKNHPEGFEKLANAYLHKAAALDLEKIKRFAKANPGFTTGAVLGSADGALKTTKTKKDSEIRYRLRQVRNTIVSGGAGAAIGALADSVYRQYKK